MAFGILSLTPTRPHLVIQRDHAARALDGDGELALAPDPAAAQQVLHLAHVGDGCSVEALDDVPVPQTAYRSERAAPGPTACISVGMVTAGETPMP